MTMLTALSYGAAQPTVSQSTVSLSQQLDDDYQRTVNTAYQELADRSRFKITTPDLPTLLNEMNAADANNTPDRVLGLATANMDIIQKNINAKELGELSRLILKQHDTSLAKDILAYAKKKGDRYTQAKQQFELAKYYANQNQWDDAITHLKTFDLTNDVPSQTTDEAYIIVGAALQAKKKHRDALQYYKKVKPDSEYYPVAQLDIALVYIRQDWWTDAQITLEDTINITRNNDIEMTNRLYTIMGFSQLQQGFYRNARESFRHVKINSVYSNRALLGIGMSALNQEDYAGAINAFQKLQTQDGMDMSVAQSYLLEAFTLTKTQQNDTATEKYNEAIRYYSDKVNHYDNLLTSIKDKSATAGTLKIDADIIKEHGDIKTLLEKITILSKLQEYPIPQNMLQQIANLRTRMYNTYLDLVADAIGKKQFVFNSYLNQSNFGLTRLYDNQ